MHEDWVTVYETAVEFEAQMVQDRLASSEIPAVILNQRDHAYNLSVGNMAVIRILVPPDQAEAAQTLLAAPDLSEDDLTKIALQAPPDPDE